MKLCENDERKPKVKNNKKTNINVENQVDSQDTLTPPYKI